MPSHTLRDQTLTLLLISLLISLLIWLVTDSMLPPSSAVPDSVPEIQPDGALAQRVALLARKPRALVQAQTEILDNADLHRRVECVAESVTEREIWIDTSILGRERRSVAVPFEIPVLDHSGRSFEYLMQAAASTYMK